MNFRIEITMIYLAAKLTAHNNNNLRDYNII